MKTIHTNELRLSILLITIIVISLFSSCQKEEEIIPNYVGTWTTIETLTEDTITFQIKDIITFSKNSFTETRQLYDEKTDTYFEFLQLKGNFTNTDSIMNVSITEIGIPMYDESTGKPTGKILTFKEGSLQFNSIFAELQMPKTFKSEFSVLGNTLTTKTDANNDGEYTDLNETSVYTKL